LPVRQITGPFQAKHIFYFAHGRPVSRHSRFLPKGATLTAGRLSHPQYRQPKPRLSFRHAEHTFRRSEQPFRRAEHRFREDEHAFRNAEHQFRNTPKLFDFKRNGCSPSSGNPVRLQPKSVFGFAEIRSTPSSRETIASGRSRCCAKCWRLVRAVIPSTNNAQCPTDRTEIAS